MKIIFKIDIKHNDNIKVLLEGENNVVIDIGSDSSKSLTTINSYILDNLDKVTLEKDDSFKNFSNKDSTIYKVAEKIYEIYTKELKSIRNNLF